MFCLCTRINSQRPRKPALGAQRKAGQEAVSTPEFSGARTPLPSKRRVALRLSDWYFQAGSILPINPRLGVKSQTATNQAQRGICLLEVAGCGRLSPRLRTHPSSSLTSPRCRKARAVPGACGGPGEGGEQPASLIPFKLADQGDQVKGRLLCSVCVCGGQGFFAGPPSPAPRIPSHLTLWLCRQRPGSTGGSFGKCTTSFQPSRSLTRAS